MAIRYKALTELYQETQRSVTAPDQWRAFWLLPAVTTGFLSMNNCLSTLSAPDATAVLRSSDGTGNLGAG